jgi:hypothetical protein
MDPTDDVTVRSRWSRVAIAFVVVAVLVLAGAIAFLVTADHHRSSAERERAHARHLLAEQRQSTQQSEGLLAGTVTQIQNFNHAVGTPMATEQNVSALGDQDLTAEQVVQNAGASATVDDYNNAIDSANALVTQYNAALDTLNQQLKALPLLPESNAPKSV